VRLGRGRARALYVGMVYGAFATAQVPWIAGSDSLSPWLALVAPAAALAVPVVRTVRTRTDGPALNGALARTGMLQLVFCTLLAAGILAS